VFKRSVTVQTPKMSTAYDSAMDRLGPAYETAKDRIGPAYETAKESSAQAYETAKEHLGPAYESAKEHIGPAYETAKESGAHALQAAIAALVPVVAAAGPAMVAAKNKGADLLASDAAQEARDRAALMLAAAKGEAVAKKRRRWPLVVAFFAVGAAVGTAVSTWFQRLTEDTSATYAEHSHAGPKVDLTHPLTETDPQPVTVLPDVTEELSDDNHSDDNGRVEDYSDPKAAF